jgi:hypothetical protein
MDFVPYQRPSGRWVLKPDRCFLTDRTQADREAPVNRTVDRLMGQSTRVEEASDEAKKLVSIIHRLPNEIKVHIFDHVAASQPEKYLTVIRPGHVHLFADDMLKHLPSIDTAKGLVHPALDWISLAKEAIVKNAIFHIETDFTIPFPGSMLQQSKHIQYLSLTNMFIP